MLQLPGGIGILMGLHKAQTCTSDLCQWQRHCQPSLADVVAGERSSEAVELEVEMAWSHPIQRQPILPPLGMVSSGPPLDALPYPHGSFESCCWVPGPLPLCASCAQTGAPTRSPPLDASGDERAGCQDRGLRVRLQGEGRGVRQGGELRWEIE